MRTTINLDDELLEQPPRLNGDSVEIGSPGCSMSDRAGFMTRVSEFPDGIAASLQWPIEGTNSQLPPTEKRSQHPDRVRQRV